MFGQNVEDVKRTCFYRFFLQLLLTCSLCLLGTRIKIYVAKAPKQLSRDPSQLSAFSICWQYNHLTIILRIEWEQLKAS